VLNITELFFRNCLRSVKRKDYGEKDVFQASEK
jgi:hypothetical protein